MAEFQWWLLLLGLVAGGGVVAVVFLDAARRDADISAEELPTEATWIARRMSNPDPVDPSMVHRILEQHRAYLQEPPPDRG